MPNLARSRGAPSFVGADERGMSGNWVRMQREQGTVAGKTASVRALDARGPAAGGRRIALGFSGAGKAVAVAGTMLVCAGMVLGQSAAVPAQVLQARRFLAARGMDGRGSTVRAIRAKSMLSQPSVRGLRPAAQGAQAPAWVPLGPKAVISDRYGLVTGRVTALALDSADATGNTLYVGTTGGGVWKSLNAATSDAANVAFVPLTDHVPGLSTTIAANISVGAVTVQPGGTGVILAGTGDPNDALDSYYGGGILRSTDGGNTWSLIQQTVLTPDSAGFFGFIGEGFGGFAWSTVNPNVVVAAVSQAYEGQLVDAPRSSYSYMGLYWSGDSGATWHLAKITDPNDQVVQSASDAYFGEGNAATSVVWNPVRRMFIAALRFHGYYQSTDGANWIRMTNQPGAGLTAKMCPPDVFTNGSTACPVFRGTLAVNPVTGDTFAWTVDLNNQDQGLWQDACAASGGTCGNQTVSWGKQWSTAALESNTSLGAVTISNGDYNLALAAVPSGQDTVLLAGANDVWKCSLAMGCLWRNTTNTNSCASAQVGAYQHAIEWSATNSLEVLIGNDSGLWRSEDGIGQTGSVCASTDASHFQNLNGALGSLAEIESAGQVGASPYTMLVGMGANGTAGVKGATGATSQWPEILGGEGGPVAIDPVNANNWYVNNGAGVSIHLCTQSGGCTPADFGQSPVVGNAQVNGDGLTMTAPAMFLVDPVDSSQLLIGTCRVWRGPANGVGWTTSNAISPMLDGNVSKSYCSGNALIRSMAALPLPGGGEVVYVGTYGAQNGGGSLGGHLLKATMNGSGVWSAWTDLSLNPVTNIAIPFNQYHLDISSIYVDPHDTSGNTVYTTIAGLPNVGRSIYILFRSTDGGAHWTAIQRNLPYAPANSVVVDPVDANTVYVATDLGVYSTQQIANCTTTNCWTAYGTGLPTSPVVQLSASPPSGSPSVLVAATYGRGLWQVPLLTAGTQLTTANASASSLSFGDQPQGSASAAQTITVTNTGNLALQPTSVLVTTGFAETDNCEGATINPGDRCQVQVSFTPQTQGVQSGQLTIAGNLSASIVVALSGNGVKPSTLQVSPTVLDFGSVEAGTISTPLQITVQNSDARAVTIGSVTVTGPFTLSGNVCGTTLAASSACQLLVEFEPATAGAARGQLTMVDSWGTQTVQLSGTGTAQPTDTLGATSLTFGETIIGTNSAAQAVTLTNSGGNPLTGIAVSVSGPFQQSNDCTTQLSANSRCGIQVQFLPTAAGTQTGTLTIADILRTQTVALSGTGVSPPAFRIVPASLTFAAQTVGAASQPQTLTIINSGGAAMSNFGFQISGSSAASFAMGTSSCGATLASGASCTMQVIFTPATAGGLLATLTLSASNAKAATVALNGTGQTAAALVVSPTQLTFAAQAIGQTSAGQTVTITNNGGTAAAGLALSASGWFAVAQTMCGTSLAAGASCTAAVTFTPMQTGALTGVLTIQSSSLSAATTVALSGIGGLTGAVQVQPARVGFPATGVGTTSGAVVVTLTNTGSASLASLALSASDGFQIASTTCGSALASAANCTVSVVSSPTKAGAISGALTIHSSALAADAQVPLTGTGFDFAVNSSGSLSQTIVSGQTASYTLKLSASVASAATFTFTCGTLPAHAACTFNPSSNVVAANSTGTEMVQIATSQTSAQLERRGWLGGAMGVSLACGLLAVPFARRRRRLLALVLASLALVSIASCASSGGGGGSTPPSNPSSYNTPAGTYTIPLTVTADGVQHTVTLTLVVQ